MDNYIVYMHVTPSNKRYIGITKRKPKYRWNNGKGYELNNHFYNAILKYGWDNIKHIIIAENLTKDQACKMEQRLIKTYNTTSDKYGYNHSLGGESGGLGVVFTEERKEKIRKASTGKKHKEESKRKMSEGHKGLPAWNKGRSWTDQEKEIMSKAQKSKKILCVETNIIYNSTREAERKTGINRSSIKDCAHGRKNCKTAGGYHWEYIEKR